MNDEILKLAKECDFDKAMRDDEHGLSMSDWAGEIEAFFCAAFNAGLEAGAKVCERMEGLVIDEFQVTDHIVEQEFAGPTECAGAIRALKLEQQ